MLRIFRILLKILLPLIVIIVAIYLAKSLMDSAPKQERRSKPPSLQTVELVTVKSQDYAVTVHSQGTVEPRTQGTLVAEVSGRVLKISPHFNNGGFFNKGDLLIQIDREDYQQTLVTVKAELSQTIAAIQEAEAAMQNAQAQTNLARNDWNRFGDKKGKPSALALHLPELASKKAALAGKKAALQATKARIQQAKTMLARTTIRAPYAGRILKKQMDIGQYVSTGTVLASIYAVDKVEIRLPLTDQQASFIKLPESYQGEKQTTTGTTVSILAVQTRRHNSSSKPYLWQGTLVRTEGNIDVQSRQQFVIAQIEHPYARQKDNRPPLKVGQFVQAEIKGITLSDVIVLPRDIVRGENEVLVVSKENTVELRQLDILWRDDKEVVLRKGLKAGERVSITPLTFATNGMSVQIKGEKKKGKGKGQQKKVISENKLLLEPPSKPVTEEN